MPRERGTGPRRVQGSVPAPRTIGAVSWAGRADARVALVAALVLGAAFVLVVALRTPWTVLPTPPGGAVAIDPTAGLPAAVVSRANSFAATLRPASVAALVLGLAVAGVLGLTPLGARLVRALAAPLGGGWGWQVLLGAVALTVIGQLVPLPLVAYGEVVRHRYGLSTRSWPLFFRDVAVSTGIGAALTAAVLLALVGLVRLAPRTWWIWAALGAAALVVAGSFLYPVLIEPAFNRFTPMPAGQLRTDLIQLARDNGTPVSDVLVSDASRRTTGLNAYVSGFGSTRRIVVYDTVLRQLPDDEIESIVAHELGHVSADDVLTGTLIGALGAAFGVALLGWLLAWTPLLSRAGVSAPSEGAVVPLVLFLVAMGGLLATPVQNVISRHIEARADVHALDLTHDPGAFTAMQQRLSAANLIQPDPPAAWQWFFGSHPTPAERVALAADWTLLGRQR